MATIKDSKSFIAFANAFGPTCKLADFTNGTTGECFKSLVFINKKDEKTLVGFSSKLGELSPKDIIAQATTLQVVQLDSGNWYLCKQGGNYQDIDLSQFL